jgi:exonuclease VII large subunit
MDMQNNLSVGQYDIRIVGNSTMPSNKWAEWQIYLEAFQLGLIDREEALKKTEIFDKEGVLKRTDAVAQMQQQLAQAEEQMKNLSGDLQTARRSEVASRQRTEVEKYKSELTKIKEGSKADAKVALTKLEMAVKPQEEETAKVKEKEG